MEKTKCVSYIVQTRDASKSNQKLGNQDDGKPFSRTANEIFRKCKKKRPQFLSLDILISYRCFMLHKPLYRGCSKVKSQKII